MNPGAYPLKRRMGWVPASLYRYFACATCFRLQRALRDSCHPRIRSRQSSQGLITPCRVDREVSPKWKTCKYSVDATTFYQLINEMYILMGNLSIFQFLMQAFQMQFLHYRCNMVQPFQSQETAFSHSC